MSEYIHKSHNVSVLIYHLVCPAKYHRVGFSQEVDTVLKEVYLEIAKRYDRLSARQSDNGPFFQNSRILQDEPPYQFHGTQSRSASAPSTFDSAPEFPLTIPLSIPS